MNNLTHPTPPVNPGHDVAAFAWEILTEANHGTAEAQRAHRVLFFSGRLPDPHAPGNDGEWDTMEAGR